MKKSTLLALAIVTLLIVGLRDAGAYPRYNSGCQTCHGAFTGGTSPKGTIFPSGDKHQMHRSSSNMNTDCDLCHTSGDGRDPFLKTSNGTIDTQGMGCVGCHEPFGLRAHHAGATPPVTLCAGCHPSDPPPPSEGTLPAYYTSPDTDVASPCNTTAQANLNENWSVGDFLGLDNDGDGLYDGDDPDCGAVTPSPGLLAGLRVADNDRTNSMLTVTYDTTACEVSNTNFYFGALDQVASTVYTGENCGIGNSGTHAWNYPATPEAVFFLVVGHNGTQEGSYGTDAAGTERSPAGLCPETQELTNRCDVQ